MSLDKMVQLGKAHSLVSTLVLNNYFGELSFKFEHGNIIHMRTTQNFKMEDLGKDGVKLVQVGADASSSEGNSEIPGAERSR